MKKKNILILIAVIMITSILSTIVLKNLGKNTGNIISSGKEKENENVNVKKTYNVSSNFELSVDLTKAKTMYEINDYIAIAKITSIDGCSNINKVSGEYISNPYTYGKLEIINMIKGSIPNNEINFVRSGGKITYDEWVKGQSNPEKLLDLKESDDSELKGIDAKEIIVDYKAMDDIEIEEGKTYLIYFTKYDDFNIDNEYTILCWQYGLREIDTSSISTVSINSNNYDNIKVKDNDTNEYVSLSSLVNFNEAG